MRRRRFEFTSKHFDRTIAASGLVIALVSLGWQIYDARSQRPVLRASLMAFDAKPLNTPDGQHVYSMKLTVRNEGSRTVTLYRGHYFASIQLTGDTETVGPGEEFVPVTLREGEVHELRWSRTVKTNQALNNGGPDPNRWTG
jgi:hypothetical protein